MQLNIKLTNQMAFDIMRKHLLTQRAKSVGPGYTGFEQCRYRSEDGLKCAVGALIPDELYSPKFETGIRNIMCNDGDIEEFLDSTEEMELLDKLRGYLGSVSLDLLMKVQDIHDYQPVGKWEDGLKECADHFGLQWE